MGAFVRRYCENIHKSQELQEDVWRFQKDCAEFRDIWDFNHERKRDYPFYLFNLCSKKRNGCI